MVTYIHRSMESTLVETAGIFPAVTLLGPRQSGKTTLVRHAFPEYTYVNLELPDDRSLAAEDPRSFFGRYPQPLIIDEVQRVPSLLSYIQVMIDEERGSRGQFILTGSHQPELRASISQSLAGRTGILTLLPLSLRELSSSGQKLERDKCIYTGFLPGIHEAVLPPSRIYAAWYQTYVERDVRQLAAIHNLIAFETFIRLLAGRVGQLVNLSDLAASTGTSSTTLAHWLAVLEASYIVFRLPPWFENFGKRLVKTPKIYFTEPGLAAWLLGIRDAEQPGLNPALGGLFENMVIVEALKSFLNRGEEPALHFYRDSRGFEMDLLAGDLAGLVPIEIKASRTFSPDFCADFPSMRALNDRIAPGLLIYGGDRAHNFRETSIVPFPDTASALEAALEKARSTAPAPRE